MKNKLIKELKANNDKFLLLLQKAVSNGDISFEEYEKIAHPVSRYKLRKIAELEQSEVK